MAAASFLVIHWFLIKMNYNLQGATSSSCCWASRCCTSMLHVTVGKPIEGLSASCNKHKHMENGRPNARLYEHVWFEGLMESFSLVHNISLWNISCFLGRKSQDPFLASPGINGKELFKIQKITASQHRSASQKVLHLDSNSHHPWTWAMLAGLIVLEVRNLKGTKLEMMWVVLIKIAEW